MKSEISISWFDNKFSLNERFVVETVFRDAVSFDDIKDIDEPDMLRYAGENGVAGLLYRKLMEKQQFKFSGNLTSKLKNEYLKSLLFNTNLINSAKQINSLFNDNDVPVMFLKGILLAPFLYDEVALRPMSDIDLLVPKHLAEKAFDLIVANGALLADPEEKDHPDNHHLPMVIFKGAPLEIHRFLIAELSSFFIPPKDIFQNSINWESNSLTLPGPSYNHTFIYMSVHVYNTFRQGGMRLSWMADFMFFIKKEMVNVDDEDFRYWVKVWKLSYPVEFILTIANLLMGKEDVVYSGKNEKKLALDISMAVQFFRMSAEDKTSYSYRIIWEQIRNAKGLSQKYAIVKSKIFRREEKGGVIFRLFKLTGRFTSMILNNIEIGLRRIFGRY
jgi:hypothetical protein